MVVNRSPVLRFILAALVIAIPAAAFAAPVGKAIGGGSFIEWQLSVSGHERVTLTVSTPDGEVFSKDFAAGSAVVLNLKDLPSSIDGNYIYQLSVSPRISAAVREQLEKARAAGNEAGARAIMKAAGIAEPVMQTGGFAVLNGSIVAPDRSEGGRDVAPGGPVANSVRNEGPANQGGGTTSPARPGTPVVNDQVIPDDLIVQGSACVGLDCVNNESFGFDTIRLKENNTRIKFDDTSSSAGFPANDWQLTANDSASGGSSKFSIEDITGSKVPFTITAGASTNSIFVDSTGRVGFRTSTPVLDLHIATSNTPAIRLEQNNSGGFTAQTWDIAGNEANFFVRDVTSGSRLPFRIRPGAPTSSVDISADGDVGIGTASPEAQLHVFGDNTADTFVGIGPNPDGNPGTESALTYGYSGSSFGRASAFFNVRPDSGATAPNPSLRFATGNTVRMIIDNEGFIALGTLASSGGNPTSPIHYTNGGVTAILNTSGQWVDNSSRKTKDHIENLTADVAMQTLKDLTPVTFVTKVDPTDQKVGFIAEEVPELVAVPDRKGLVALDIVAVVTKVVQEQQKTIEQLNERIAQLEKEKQQQ